MKRFGFIILCFCVLSFSYAQNMEVIGQVSNRMQQQIGGSFLYLKNLTTGEKMDSCQLNGNAFAFHGIPANQKAPFCIFPLGIYFVSEPGTLTIDADQVLSGTLLNELWNAYLQDRAKYVRDFNRQYQAAKNDVLLSKEQRNGLLQSLEDEYEATFKSRVLNMMRRNLNNPVNALSFLEYADRIEDVATFDQIYALTSETTRECPSIHQVALRMERLRKTSPGEIFVDFTVPGGNMDGSVAHLSDYVGKGKYILVDFWASWCGPCRREALFLKKAYDKYRGSHFDILGVATWDKRKDTLKAMEQEHFPWPQILDAGEISSETYGFNGIPQIMLFGPDGKILARDLRGEEMLKKIGEYLDQ